MVNGKGIADTGGLIGKVMGMVENQEKQQVYAAGRVMAHINHRVDEEDTAQFAFNIYDDIEDINTHMERFLTLVENWKDLKRDLKKHLNKNG